MRLYASTNGVAIEQGLWGDTFCIRWISNWLNISVVVWSLKNTERNFLFNKDANTNPYCILYHDTNSDCGHYEPLLCKRQPAMNIEKSNDYLSLICKDLQNY